MQEVLPLGIKPPVIPLFVLLLDVIVAIPAWKTSQMTHAESARDFVVSPVLDCGSAQKGARGPRSLSRRGPRVLRCIGDCDRPPGAPWASLVTGD